MRFEAGKVRLLVLCMVYCKDRGAKLNVNAVLNVTDLPTAKKTGCLAEAKKSIGEHLLRVAVRCVPGVAAASDGGAEAWDLE